MRQGFPIALVAVADLDGFQVERAEHQLNPPSDQRRVDLVGVGVRETVAVLVTMRSSRQRNASVSSTWPPSQAENDGPSRELYARKGSERQRNTRGMIALS